MKIGRIKNMKPNNPSSDRSYLKNVLNQKWLKQKTGKKSDEQKLS